MALTPRAFLPRAAATAALLIAVALASSACSSSSSPCTYPPGPVTVVAVHAPCGLAITAIAVTGPCQQGGTTSAPSLSGTGAGTCNISATLSNGAPEFVRRTSQ